MNLQKVTRCVRVGAVWLLVSFTATISCAATSKNPDVCGLKQLASLDLFGDANLLVPTTVQSKSAYLVLHTDSAFSLLFDPALEMFGFRKQPIVGLGLSTGGVALKELANVYELQLGNVKFNKVQFIIYPGTASLEMYNGLPIVGSLSMDMLENVDFELDLAHKKLNLFSQEHCAGKVVYWTNEYASAPIFKSRIGTLYFPMELDGKKVEATFHTADQNSSLSTEITKKVYDFDEKSEDTEKVTAPNGSATYFYRAMTISAPGLAINNARLRLDTSSSKGCVPSKRISDTKAAGYTGCMGIYPLTLGRDTLSKLRIYVATKEKMIYYSSANATKEPAAAAK